MFKIFKKKHREFVIKNSHFWLSHFRNHSLFKREGWVINWGEGELGLGFFQV